MSRRITARHGLPRGREKPHRSLHRMMVALAARYRFISSSIRSST
jgi:hypothetical protein